MTDDYQDNLWSTAFDSAASAVRGLTATFLSRVSEDTRTASIYAKLTGPQLTDLSRNYREALLVTLAETLFAWLREHNQVRPYPIVAPDEAQWAAIKDQVIEQYLLGFQKGI